MHDVFSDWVRRAILYYLTHRDGPVPVADLVHQLIAWGRDSPTEPPIDGIRIERLQPRLYAAHVREMEDFGLLSYDPITDRVWIPGEVTISVPAPWTRSAETDTRTIPEPDGPVVTD